MVDQFSEVTTTSWGKRLTDSVMGTLVGFACFIGAFMLLWWGEGRSIDRIRTLDEGRALVVAVSSEEVDDKNEGKLVHFSGEAESEETLSDEDFGIYEEEALKLKRTVSMYQWQEEKSTETKENVGGSETTKTTYSYSKDWSDRLIDSSDFKKQDGHENPATMPYDSEEQTAPDIFVGDFWLGQSFVDQISDYEPFPLTDEIYAEMDEDMQKSLTLSGKEYFSGDPKKPQVGDVRIAYEIIRPHKVSVIGKQEEGYVTAYTTKNGSLDLLYAGVVDAEGMFAQAESENKLLTWLLRGGGIALMWLGLVLMLRPIRMLGAVIPFVGTVLGAGIGLVCGVVALGLGTTTIAIAWLFYRPIVGAIVLAVALGLIFGGWRLIKGKIKSMRDGAGNADVKKAA